MELVTVGTGTVAPSARRTAACHWVQRGDLWGVYPEEVVQ